MEISFIAVGMFCVSCLPAFAANKPSANWVGTWSASPMAYPVKSSEPSAGDSTYRNIMRISIDGRVLGCS
jgi:hypothetical protein